MMAALGDDAVRQEAAGSPLQQKYGEPVDRDSAYERLTGRIASGPGGEATPVEGGAAPDAPPPAQPPAGDQAAEPEEKGWFSKVGDFLQQR